MLLKKKEEFVISPQMKNGMSTFNMMNLKATEELEELLTWIIPQLNFLFIVSTMKNQEKKSLKMSFFQAK